MEVLGATQDQYPIHKSIATEMRRRLGEGKQEPRLSFGPFAVFGLGSLPPPRGGPMISGQSLCQVGQKQTRSGVHWKLRLENTSTSIMLELVELLPSG